YFIHASFDHKGNAIRYIYLPEDGAGIDVATANEANRTPATRGNQRYLKAIQYGNVQPYFPDWAALGAEPTLPADWHFAIVLDYGDHDPLRPTPVPDRQWNVRPDPFSTYRPGFEVRTYRRCERA